MLRRLLNLPQLDKGIDGVNTFEEPGTDAAPGPDPARILFVCRPHDLERLIEETKTTPDAAIHVPDVFRCSLLLTRQPLVKMVVLSLAGLYPQELLLIEAIKRNRPGVQVVVADASRRGAALARATRLGADRLLTSDGLVSLRGASSPLPPTGPEPDPAQDQEEDPPDPDPFLSSAELRALLGP